MPLPNNWSTVALVGHLVTDDNDPAAGYTIQVVSSQTRLQDSVSHRVIFPKVDQATPAAGTGYFRIPVVVSDTDTDITPEGRSHKVTLLSGGKPLQSWFVTVDHTQAVQLRFAGDGTIVESGGTLADAIWVTDLAQFTDAPSVTPIGGGVTTEDLAFYFTKTEADARFSTPASTAAAVAEHVAQPDPHGQYALDSDLTTGLAGKANISALSAHTSSTSNPHSVTKAQVGLGSADNTADSAKPVSAAQQAAIDAASTPDATPSVKGRARLLGGTADAPTVPYGSVTGAPASLPPSGGAGGVLGGMYPNPSFAVDMATQAELNAVAATVDQLPFPEGSVDQTGAAPGKVVAVADDDPLSFHLVTPSGGEVTQAGLDAAVATKTARTQVTNPASAFAFTAPGSAFAVGVDLVENLGFFVTNQLFTSRDNINLTAETLPSGVVATDVVKVVRFAGQLYLIGRDSTSGNACKVYRSAPRRSGALSWSAALLTTASTGGIGWMMNPSEWSTGTNYLYVCDYGDPSGGPSVWRSPDGTTWEKTLGPISGLRHFHCIAPDPYTPGHVYLTGGDGQRQQVWRSTDSGATWSLIITDNSWQAGQIAFSPRWVWFAGDTALITAYVLDRAAPSQPIIAGANFHHFTPVHGGLPTRGPFTDGVLTASSTTFTSATAAFTSADKGRFLRFPEYQPISKAGGIYITAVNSGTSVTLNKAPGGNATGVGFFLEGDTWYRTANSIAVDPITGFAYVISNDVTSGGTRSGLFCLTEQGTSWELIEPYAGTTPGEIFVRDRGLWSHQVAGRALLDRAGVAPAAAISETWTGTDGAAWPGAWSTNGVGTRDINANRGRHVTAAAGYSMASNHRAAPDNGELLCRFRWTSIANERYQEWGVRFNTGSDLGYIGSVRYSGSGSPIVQIEKKGGGGGLIGSSANVSVAADTWYWVRLRWNGPQLKMRFWADGTDEPQTWQVSGTDAAYTYTTGNLALRSWTGAGAQVATSYLDDLTVIDLAANPAA